MATPNAKAETLVRKWYVVNAEDAVLGRMATRIATILRGKHKPTYTPHVDCGDFVIVTNAKVVKTTGKKEEKKIYWKHTGFVGGEKTIDLGKQRAEHPERIIVSAIKGMLPRGPLGRKMIKKLKVYADGNHQHQAQNPTELKF